MASWSVGLYCLCLCTLLQSDGALRITKQRQQMEQVKCPSSEIEKDWLQKGLELTLTKSSGRAYVLCGANFTAVRTPKKVSCNPEECNGDKWCFVENHCGAWWNPCKKIEPACNYDFHCRCEGPRCDMSLMSACARHDSRFACHGWVGCKWQGLVPKPWPLDECSVMFLAEDECSLRSNCAWRNVSYELCPSFAPNCPWRNATYKTCQARNRRVKAITVWAGEFIDAIQFQYDDLTNLTFGSSGGLPQPTWNVPPGEYLTQYTMQIAGVGVGGVEFYGIAFNTSGGTVSPWYGANSWYGAVNETQMADQGSHIVGLEGLVRSGLHHRHPCGRYSCAPGRLMQAPIEEFVE